MGLRAIDAAGCERHDVATVLAEGEARIGFLVLEEVLDERVHIDVGALAEGVQGNGRVCGLGGELAVVPVGGEASHELLQKLGRGLLVGGKVLVDGFGRRRGIAGVGGTGRALIGLVGHSGRGGVGTGGVVGVGCTRIGGGGRSDGRSFRLGSGRVGSGLGGTGAIGGGCLAVGRGVGGRRGCLFGFRGIAADRV